MKQISRTVLLITFFIIMLYPLLSKALPNQDMSGVFEEEELPVLNAGNLFNGTYQSGIENYIREHLPGREYLIKTKNQLVFDVFRKSPVEKVIIGKNRQMFSRSFIDLWYQLKGPTTDEFMEELADTLYRFKNLMDSQNIQTVLYITPSKARFCTADIPDIYRMAAPSNPEKSAYEKLLQYTVSLQIPTFDSIAYLESVSKDGMLDGLDMFSKTGTHWTQTTGAKVAIALGDYLEESCGYDLAEMTVESVPVEVPEYPDADIYGILNIYTKPYDSYTKPAITVTDTGTDSPKLLCRGGSFMGQSLAHLIRQGYFSDDIYMENTQFFKNRFSEVQTCNDYKDVDLKEAFQDTDILILEVNEASIDVMGFGFMEYVLEHHKDIFGE